MTATVCATNTKRPASTAAIPGWFGVLVVTALWLLARPYVGLRHDGILYVGQALLHLAPTAMSQDIFFVNGSQDSFTAVSPLLAELYARWGVDVVQIAVPGLCQAVLLAIVYRLLKPLPAMERWMGLAALAVLSHAYGGFGIFAFGERFVTGRTLAEPVALLALVLILHGRVAWGAFAGLGAAALHPLVTLPVLVVGWLFLIQGDRRWGWAAPLALLPLAAAFLGLPPFAALLQTYDDEWWQLVRLANGQVLVSDWGVVDWQVVALDLGVLAGAARVLPRPLKRLALAAVVAAVGLLAISAVGADWWRNVLITQLQLWRVLWLVHLLSLAVLPAIVLQLWRRGPSGQLASLALCATVVAVNGLWEQGWVFLVWTAASLLMLHLGKPLRPGLQRAAMAATSLALVGLSLAVAMRTMNLLALQQGELDAPTWALLIFTMPALALPVAAGLFVAFERGALPAVLALLLVVLGLAYAAASWDRRSDWTRFVETGLQREHPFAALIPATAQVYWHGDLSATWLLLRRPSYYSGGQGAGLLFNRETATEFKRRHAMFEPVALQEKLCSTLALLNADKTPDSECMPTEELVEHLCGAASGPDFLVFQRRLPRGVVASWTFLPANDGARTYHLYDCRQLR